MERDIRPGDRESDRSGAERKRRHCARCRAESGGRTTFETCVRTGGYDTGECY